MVAEPDSSGRRQLHGFVGRADPLGAGARRWEYPHNRSSRCALVCCGRPCNGLSVLAIYGALEYGPVAIISPLIASYRLVTLLLSRAFLKRIAEISARWGGRRESRRSASVLIGSRLDPRRRRLDSLARWTNWLR